MDSLSMELEVIRSIFDKFVEVYEETRVVFYRFEDNTNMCLIIQLPSTYPFTGDVNIDVEFKVGQNFDEINLTPVEKKDLLDEIKNDLNEFAHAHTGENVLFDLINEFKSIASRKLKKINNPQLKNTNSSKQREVITNYFTTSENWEKKLEKRDCSNSIPAKLGIIHGDKRTVKKSIFQAHYAQIKCLDDVAMFKEQLLEDKRASTATHNIVVYKLKHPLSGKVEGDFDDDGETGAGRKLLGLINKINSLDNIVIAVSRWFGGVPLGPGRFRVINDVAIELLRKMKQLP